MYRNARDTPLSRESVHRNKKCEIERHRRAQELEQLTLLKNICLKNDHRGRSMKKLEKLEILELAHEHMANLMQQEGYQLPLSRYSQRASPPVVSSSAERRNLVERYRRARENEMLIKLSDLHKLLRPNSSDTGRLTILKRTKEYIEVKSREVSKTTAAHHQIYPVPEASLTCQYPMNSLLPAQNLWNLYSGYRTLAEGKNLDAPFSMESLASSVPLVTPAWTQFLSPSFSTTSLLSNSSLSSSASVSPNNSLNSSSFTSSDCSSSSDSSIWRPYL